jgi:hypothetical protein
MSIRPNTGEPPPPPPPPPPPVSSVGRTGSPVGSPVARRGSPATDIASAAPGSSAAAFASLVVFRVRVDDKFGFGEDVYVCGDTPSLGMFDPNRGVQLHATNRSYPFFESVVVPLKRGAAIEYKYAIFVGGRFDRWEAIGYNRCIRADELAQNTDINMQGRLSEDEDEIVTHTTNDALGVTPDEPPPPAPDVPMPTASPAANFGAHYTPLMWGRYGNSEQEVRIR